MAAAAIALAAIKLAGSGVDLTRQILARTSPRELRELEELEKSRLSLENKITDYKKLQPSDRIQAKLESYLSDLEKVYNEIILMQGIAKQKITLMLGAVTIPTE